MVEDDQKADKATGRIQSLERAFAILEEISRHRDGATLTDLSRTLGLHTSTLYHLVKTLTALGYLRQGEDSKRYRLGRGMFLLAAACREEVELTNAVKPYLERLAEETGESTHFAIWDRGTAVILARASGSKVLQMTERTGTPRPLHCTAIGKALLSGLSPAECEAAIRGLAFDIFTPTTLTGPAALLAQVDKARIEGVAFDDCEYNAEVRCMAVPVRDFRGKIAGAIGFSGPVWRMSLSQMAAFTPRCIAIAAELSEELGHRPTASDAKTSAAM